MNTIFTGYSNRYINICVIIDQTTFSIKTCSLIRIYYEIVIFKIIFKWQVDSAFFYPIWLYLTIV